MSDDFYFVLSHPTRIMDEGFSGAAGLAGKRELPQSTFLSNALSMSSKTAGAVCSAYVCRGREPAVLLSLRDERLTKVVVGDADGHAAVVGHYAGGQVDAAGDR